MSSNIVNINGSTPPSDAKKLYLHALRLIMDGKEEEAGHALNKTRDFLAGSKTLTDSHTQTLFPDLTVRKFESLYGDYKHTDPKRKNDAYGENRTLQEWEKAASPWIKQPELLDMITAHIKELGDKTDQIICGNFLEQTDTHFKTFAPLPQLVLVA